MSTRPAFKAPNLAPAVADLMVTRPGPGMRKAAFLIALVAASVALTLAQSSWLLVLPLAVVTGLCAGAAFALTHDAIHHTLTGVAWLDEVLARVISWPFLWPHGLYMRLHRLHHQWNGYDLRDPERVQPTAGELLTAPPLRRFFYRHPVLRAFLAGSNGLVYGVVTNYVRLRPNVRAWRATLVVEVTGLLLTTAALFGLFYALGVLPQWIVTLLIAGRIMGFIHGMRSLAEHHGLWDEHASFQLTQLYAARNFRTTPFLCWYLNGLAYHSAHHAFPAIPFYHLAEATTRLDQALAARGLPPLVYADGYGRALAATGDS